MDKKYIAIFRKAKLEVDEFDKIELEEKISLGKKFLYKGIMLNPSEFKMFQEISVKSSTDILMENYLKSVKERLLMSPKERAENTKGHFGFWFYILYKKELDEKTWEKVKPLIEKFYEKNPDFIFPSVKFYFYKIKGSKELKADENGMRILERVEANLLDFQKRKAVENSDLTFLKS